MEVTLRQLRSGPDGIPEYADSEVSAEVLTIGSGSASQVQLLGRSVLPEHAVIRGNVISARGRARLKVNGADCRSASLKPGDVIEIAGHRITVTPVPPGFDLALTIEPDTEAKKSEFEGAFRTDPSQTWLSKRRATWALVLATPLLIFLIPFATVVAQRNGVTLPSWLPDDQMWSAGPLIPAHEQAAGRRCEACHTSFFARVRDSDCRECHKSIVDHITPVDLAQTQLGPQARCGSCHQEHGGGTLVMRGDTLCTDCHSRPRERFGRLNLAAVSGFSKQEHPAFKATVLRPVAVSAAQLASLPERDTPAGAAAQVWTPVQVPVTGGQESSNLKFSHRQHLDGSLVQRRADSQPLACGDCHVLTPDGTQFEPITMAATCSGCHDLSFDARNPTRQLPHGRPGDAILLVQDYYAHKLLDPGSIPETARPAAAPRRLPDSKGSEQACESGTPAARGACFAELEILTQFTRRGCVSCHEVSDAGRGAPAQDRFTIQPVRLVSDYLPGVHFSHRAHAVQNGLTGQRACLSCHEATASQDSRRLMIPDRGKCLECHGETPARDRVQLGCVSCHAYHADHSERPSQHT
jgi:predicted CXXCH cytochrome family protein